MVSALGFGPDQSRPTQQPLILPRPEQPAIAATAYFTTHTCTTGQDPAHPHPALIIYRQAGAGFTRVEELTREDNAVLTTPLTPGLEVPLARLFADE